MFEIKIFNFRASILILRTDATEKVISDTKNKGLRFF